MRSRSASATTDRIARAERSAWAGKMLFETAEWQMLAEERTRCAGAVWVLMTV
jgi:hypothetical protein